MNTKPATLAQTVGIRLMTGLILCLVIAGAAFYATATQPAPVKGDSADVMDTRPHAEGSVAGLMQRHDCWTDEAPADVEIPGGVIVTIDGDPRHAGEKMVGKAFEQVFDETDHGLTIHGFCRK